MPLKPGRYQIRYVPPHITLPFAGGVFAVGKDINKPVEALPLGPSPGVRTWEVTFAPDNKEQYVIVAPGFKSPSVFQAIGPVRAGWGRSLRKDVDTEGLDPAAAAEAEIKSDKEAEDEGILPQPDLPVLFTTTIKNWVITEASNGGDPSKATYLIKVPTKLVGVVAAVIVENQQLVTKNFPITSTIHYEIPTWQFIPVHTD